MNQIIQNQSLSVNVVGFSTFILSRNVVLFCIIKRIFYSRLKC